MDRLLLFFAGVFFANGIPHFVNGISGKEFVRPFLYKFVTWMPNPLFNAGWGILSMIVSMIFLKRYLILNPGFVLQPGLNAEFLIAFLGFTMASLGLSVFFMNGGW